MLSIAEAYINCREKLSSIYSAGEASSVTSFLFENLYDISYRHIIVEPEREFIHTARFTEDLEKLLQHTPVQQLVGFEFFAGLKINVNKDVLIPRPETEELIFYIKKSLGRIPDSIADVCTGSGCIALAMRKMFPDAAVIASDLSEQALAVAESNQHVNFHEQKIQWIKHDILHSEWHIPQPDLVISNPPYIPLKQADTMSENVLNYEPHMALFVSDEDPLIFYKCIIDKFSGPEVKDVFFEIHPPMADALNAFCLDRGRTCELIRDISGHLRFARIGHLN